MVVVKCVMGDVVSLIVNIVVAVVASVASVVIANATRPSTRSGSFKPTHSSNGQLPEPDPVYDLKGQRNQRRLGHPVETVYGQVRAWPSYASNPYNRYRSGEAYQYSLYSLGFGTFDTSAVPQYEDTPVTSFDEVEYAVRQPGEEIQLINGNVETSVEVTGLELLGTNEPGYGWQGPFVANASGTKTTRLEVDILFPDGVYAFTPANELDDNAPQVEFEYREVDDAGVPIGSWTNIISKEYRLKTTTPVRRTILQDVPEGRYEVRGRRTDTKDTDFRSSDKTLWEALRATIPNGNTYPDVTTVEVIAKASNNLNDAAGSRFNMVVTRKLRTYDINTGTWSNPVATRNPVWSFCDLITSRNGANRPDSYLHLESLCALADELDAEGLTFDWVFDQRTSVWEAAKTIARSVRGVPVVLGNRLTIVREKKATVPTALYGMENIVKGSFRWEVKLQGDDGSDGVEVEYVDGSTFETKSVYCLLPEDSGNAPDKLKLAGITDRTRAFREGMFARSVEKYANQQIRFKTGAEGHLPVFGDIIAINHDVPTWGDSAMVVGIAGTTVTLDKDVALTEGEDNQIFIRSATGEPVGPYSVTRGAEPGELELNGAPNLDGLITTAVGEGLMALVGVAEEWGALARVTDIKPTDEEQVEITAVVYDERVFTYDTADPPAEGPPVAVIPPDLPTVPQLTAYHPNGVLELLVVSWEPADGAAYYVLERSENGTDWQEVATTDDTSATLLVAPGTLYLRVAGVNVGRGAWATWNGTVGEPTGVPFDVTGLALVESFIGQSCKVQWNSAALATSYDVEVYDNTVPAAPVLLRTVNTTQTTYTYTSDNMVDDGVNARAFEFKVIAKNSIGNSPSPPTLAVSNPVPAALTTGITSTLTLDETNYNRYRLSWDDHGDSDIKCYRVWASTTSGFTPGSGNLIYEGPSPYYDYDITKTGGNHPAHYWKVAALDVWGSDYNASAEQTIAAV